MLINTVFLYLTLIRPTVCLLVCPLARSPVFGWRSVAIGRPFLGERPSCCFHILLARYWKVVKIERVLMAHFMILSSLGEQARQVLGPAKSRDWRLHCIATLQSGNGSGCGLKDHAQIRPNANPPLSVCSQIMFENFFRRDVKLKSADQAPPSRAH